MARLSSERKHRSVASAAPAAKKRRPASSTAKKHRHATSTAKKHRPKKRRPTPTCVWPATRILEEDASRYRVEWEGTDPATGAPWEPSWVAKSAANASLVRDWLESKEWPVQGILNETEDKYLVSWEHDSVTGEVYRDTWEPKEFISSRAIIDAWEATRARNPWPIPSNEQSGADSPSQISHTTAGIAASELDEGPSAATDEDAPDQAFPTSTTDAAGEKGEASSAGTVEAPKIFAADGADRLDNPNDHPSPLRKYGSKLRGMLQPW